MKYSAKLSDKLGKILEKYGEYAILADANSFNDSEASMAYEFPTEISLTRAKQLILALFEDYELLEDNDD